ncbi:hypothetical protein [Vibrio neptunius]|uniref:hypothetical protein n=1 Tax=Vibrio neptunius TaxID=170651 RepID=UPI003CE44A1E
MAITRQHGETEITELVGTRCEEILGVGSKLSDGLSVIFILLSGIMYKFFIDESVLFWGESKRDPEEDLDEGESYISLLPHFNIQSPAEVRKIEMKDGKLVVQFGDCAIEFRNNDDMTHVVKL